MLIFLKKRGGRPKCAVFPLFNHMIKVNQNQCIGCGLCVGMCPETFMMNADGKSEVLAQTDNECAQNAVASCPVNAISL